MPFDNANYESPTVRLLEKALALLRKGWTQGAFHKPVMSPAPLDAADKYCILGAISAAAGRSRSTVTKMSRTQEAAIDAIAASIPAKYKTFDKRAGIVRYNDARGRHKSTIIRLLQRTIDRARGLVEAK